MSSCISPSSTKVSFTKERHVDGLLGKLKKLYPGIYQTYYFSYLSVIAVFDAFLNFVVTL